jgi:uncharacterized Zn finger protein (UPF0148 family)
LISFVAIPRIEILEYYCPRCGEPFPTDPDSDEAADSTLILVATPICPGCTTPLYRKRGPSA